MSRIRSIHPRAPQDDDVASMSLAARYLWAYLPCYADREGRLEDRPLMLKGEVFPADNVEVNALLDEIAAEERGFIIRYRASNGKRLIQIVNFHRYQRPNHRERASVLPAPDGWADVGQNPGRAQVGDDETDSCPGSKPVRHGESDSCPGSESIRHGEGDSCPGNQSVRHDETDNGHGQGRSGNPVIRDPVDHTQSRACADVIPPANEADKPPPRHVLDRFAAIRAEICGGKKLFWQASPKAMDKAAAWLREMSPDAVADIEPAIRLACQKVKGGAKGWTEEEMRDPNFLFGTLVARWSGLREELHQCRPPPPGSMATRPPAKPVVREWKPKGDYAAEAAADRAKSGGGAKDEPASRDLEATKRDLANHVTPSTAA